MPAPIILRDLDPAPKKAPSPDAGQPLIATEAKLRDGWRPASLAPPEFTLSATSNSITANITNGNGATSYEIRVEGGSAVSGLTLTGLNPEETYPVQVRGTDSNGAGTWSAAVNETTSAATASEIGRYSTVLEPDGSLLFDTDFSNQPDWEVQHAGQRYLYDGWTGHDGASGFVAGDNVPPGFDYYYASEFWHPNGDKNGNDAVPGSKPVGQISALHGAHDDPNGKSFIVYDESYGTKGGWGADCVLTKDLGVDIKAFWVEYWIRFAPDFKPHGLTPESDFYGVTSNMKVMRVHRFSGLTTENRFDFFGENSRAGSPAFSQNIKVWPDGDRDYCQFTLGPRGYVHPDNYVSKEDHFGFNDGIIYDPPKNFDIYQGGSSALSWAETFGDGNWHKINVYLQMDSAPGAQDGVVEVWLNDFLEANLTDVPWRQEGDPEDIGWNEIGPGGNAHNVWDPVFSNHSEQWWQISGFKVYNGKPA